MPFKQSHEIDGKKIISEDELLLAAALEITKQKWEEARDAYRTRVHQQVRYACRAVAGMYRRNGIDCQEILPLMAGAKTSDEFKFSVTSKNKTIFLATVHSLTIDFTDGGSGKHDETKIYVYDGSYPSSQPIPEHSIEHAMETPLVGAPTPAFYLAKAESYRQRSAGLDNDDVAKLITCIDEILGKAVNRYNLQPIPMHGLSRVNVGDLTR